MDNLNNMDSRSKNETDENFSNEEQQNERIENMELYKSTDYPHTFPKHCDDINYDLNISFSESIFGCTKEIELEYDKFCNICDGVGKFNYMNCLKCGGQGNFMDNSENRVNIKNSICDTCEGYGIVYLKICPQCENGIIKSKRKIKVNIKKNIKDKSKHIIQNITHGMNGGRNGNLHVTIHVENNAKFVKIDNMNIKYILEISLINAILGNVILVPTIYDKFCKVIIPKYSQNGDIIEIKNAGLYDNIKNIYGIMFVELKVLLPKHLTNEQIQILKKVNL